MGCNIIEAAFTLRLLYVVLLRPETRSDRKKNTTKALSLQSSAIYYLLTRDSVAVGGLVPASEDSAASGVPGRVGYHCYPCDAMQCHYSLYLSAGHIHSHVDRAHDSLFLTRTIFIYCCQLQTWLASCELKTCKLRRSAALRCASQSQSC